MQNSAAALRWIVEHLEHRSIPFALVGGLAANAYGTTRPLNDVEGGKVWWSGDGISDLLHDHRATYLTSA